jgi:hypothetical protein
MSKSTSAFDQPAAGELERGNASPASSTCVPDKVVASGYNSEDAGDVARLDPWIEMNLPGAIGMLETRLAASRKLANGRFFYVILCTI